MSQTQTSYEHVVLDGAGRPLIAGTTMKVTELVAEMQAFESSPDELQVQHPYLTLGQIQSALAYYRDHASAIDQEIDRQVAEYERARAEASSSPLMARLRARKHR